MPGVAIVTDSTAYLSGTELGELDVRVVQLQVVVGDRSYPEGRLSPIELTIALRAHLPVSTSRPSPAIFSDTYEAAAAAGATSVVSVHLSGELSGTLQAAQLAAKQASIPVAVVDSKHLGLALGFLVRTAAEGARAGKSAAEIVADVEGRSARTSTLFYVDTLEYLRRGGRVGNAAAFFGNAFAVKPLLGVQDGHIVPVEKVRTSARALVRLEEWCVQLAAADGQWDIAVQHLAANERANAVAAHIVEGLTAKGYPPATAVVREIGAVLGAHVGPGFVAVAASQR